MSHWHIPRKRVEQLRYWSRVRQHNDLLLHVNPFAAQLWLRLEEGQACTCVKSTTEMADKKCSICYGTKIVGGYEKWGYETISIDYQYRNLELEPYKLRIKTELRPNRVVLDRGHESGEILTPYIQPPVNLGWVGFYADDYVYDADHSGVEYEWQEIGKTNWNPIETFPALATVERFVKFRITLWRDSRNVKSPVWGMIQVRNQISAVTELSLSRENPPRRKDRSRDTYGNSEEEGGLRYWTTKAPLITDDWFIELQTGDRENKRYRIVEFTQSEHGDEMLSQHLSLRILQPGEIYYKVF